MLLAFKLDDINLKAVKKSLKSKWKNKSYDMNYKHKNKNYMSL